MKQLSVFVFLILSSCLSVRIGIATGDQVNKTALSKLIADLGSETYGTRQKAEKTLKLLGEVPPELRKACRSNDAEIRARAKVIVSTIEGRYAQLRLREIERLAKNGEFDQAVERAVRWGEIDPAGRNLIPLAQLAMRIRGLEKTKFKKIRYLKKRSENFDIEEGVKSSFHRVKFVSAVGLLIFNENHTAILRGAGVKFGPRAEAPAFVVSAGDVISDTNIVFGPNVVFTCGSVSVKGDCLGSIIVADGDVNIASPQMGGVFIIARGNVTLPKFYLSHSVILAGGKVHKFETKQHKIPDSVLIRENSFDGLGLIKFFEPKQVGIEVEASDKGVRVKHVRKGSAFDQKLRAADVVTAIDGKKSSNPEQFRRLLRKALANAGSHMTFSVQRSDDKAEEVKVKVP